MSAFQQGHALIIGVGEHLHASDYDAPLTGVDAEVIAATLIDPAICGYPHDQVSLLTNEQASHSRIVEELERLTQQTNEDSTVFIFFSGHGLLAADKSYHLASYDMKLEGTKIVAGSGLSESKLLEIVRRIPARHLLFIVNACHAGMVAPILGTKAILGNNLPTQLAEALLATGSGRAIMTSCTADQVAYVGPGQVTLFTQLLVDGLKGQGTRNARHPSVIGLFDLYTHLYFAMEEEVPKQIPAAVRKIYGEQQYPELTISKGVGPFPVAMYRGANTLGGFDSDVPPPELATIRQVSLARSQHMLAQLEPDSGQSASGNSIRIEKNSGIVIGGDNKGSVTQKKR